MALCEADRLFPTYLIKQTESSSSTAFSNSSHRLRKVLSGQRCRANSARTALSTFFAFLINVFNQRHALRFLIQQDRSPIPARQTQPRKPPFLYRKTRKYIGLRKSRFVEMILHFLRWINKKALLPLPDKRAFLYGGTIAAWLKQIQFNSQSKAENELYTNIQLKQDIIQ